MKKYHIIPVGTARRSVHVHMNQTWNLYHMQSDAGVQALYVDASPRGV